LAAGFGAGAGFVAGFSTFFTGAGAGFAAGLAAFFAGTAALLAGFTGAGCFFTAAAGFEAAPFFGVGLLAMSLFF
jgi:hypothetical protein